MDACRRLPIGDRGYGWTPEMQVRAVEEKLRIAEFPVRSFPRAAGSPKISGTWRGTILAGAVILRTIGVLTWKRIHSRKSVDGLKMNWSFPADRTLRRREGQTNGGDGIIRHLIRSIER